MLADIILRLCKVSEPTIFLYLYHNTHLAFEHLEYIIYRLKWNFAVTLISFV